MARPRWRRTGAGARTSWKTWWRFGAWEYRPLRSTSPFALCGCASHSSECTLYFGRHTFPTNAAKPTRQRPELQRNAETKSILLPNWTKHKTRGYKTIGQNRKSPVSSRRSARGPRPPRPAARRRAAANRDVRRRRGPAIRAVRPGRGAARRTSRRGRGAAPGRRARRPRAARRCPRCAAPARRAPAACLGGPRRLKARKSRPGWTASRRRRRAQSRGRRPRRPVRGSQSASRCRTSAPERPLDSTGTTRPGALKAAATAHQATSHSSSAACPTSSQSSARSPSPWRPSSP
mmetsp:Transcript_9756/g.33719  ORF Transcript_9756/g.33719 Transcript_9756/m.33719 type:complete len:291 (+) Transcript_9756:559-1431(+)